jgi:hypothetical protein
MDESSELVAEQGGCTENFVQNFQEVRASVHHSGEKDGGVVGCDKIVATIVLGIIPIRKKQVGIP